MRTITIEQSSAEARAAFELHKNVQIESVRLAEATVRASHPTELGGETVKLDFKFRAERQPAPAAVLRILVSFLVRATPGDSPKTSPGRQPKRASASKTGADPALLVEAGFEVDYLLRDEYEPEEEAVEAFQNGNAIFNVWPYFRELLQNMTIRMGHPPLTAPFLKLRPKTQGASPQGDPDRHPAAKPKSSPTSKRKIRRSGS